MRIATWNTQGHCLSNGKLAHLVNSHSPDVICVQECGDLLNSSCSRLSGPFRSLYISSYNFGTPSRCIKYNIIYYPWRDACRCSMATFVKQGYTISDFSLKPYNTTSDRTATWYDIRDMLQTVVTYNNRVISINNVHLPSGCPKYAKNIALYSSDHLCVCYDVEC